MSSSPALQRRSTVGHASKFALRRSKSHLSPSAVPSGSTSRSSSPRHIPSSSSAPASPSSSSPASPTSLTDYFHEETSGHVGGALTSESLYPTTEAPKKIFSTCSSLPPPPPVSFPAYSSSYPSSASTYYNASYCHDDWTKLLVPTPTPSFYAKTPLDELENADIDDDVDNDGDDDADDINYIRKVPVENRILRSMSILVLFLVFLVVLLGGIHNALYPTRVEEAVLERVVQVAAAAIVSVNEEQKLPNGSALQALVEKKEINASSLDQTGKELEMKRRKNLEHKLENSISKRNRILDILLKQQDQQTLILNRQREILQLLSEQKKK